VGLLELSNGHPTGMETIRQAFGCARTIKESGFDEVLQCNDILLISKLPK
jgi:hypothetical protein